MRNQCRINYILVFGAGTGVGYDNIPTTVYPEKVPNRNWIILIEFLYPDPNILIAISDAGFICRLTHVILDSINLETVSSMHYLHFIYCEVLLKLMSSIWNGSLKCLFWFIFCFREKILRSSENSPSHHIQKTHRATRKLYVAWYYNSLTGRSTDKVLSVCCVHAVHVSTLTSRSTG